MMHIPRELEDVYFEGVRTYQELWKQLETISEANVERITLAKKVKV
jgi:hypothetical protein